MAAAPGRAGLQTRALGADPAAEVCSDRPWVYRNARLDQQTLQRRNMKKNNNNYYYYYYYF
jgi:hypothetical protein